MFAAAGISMLMIEPVPSAYAGMRPSDASASVTRSALSGSGAAYNGKPFSRTFTSFRAGMPGISMPGGTAPSV